MPQYRIDDWRFGMRRDVLEDIIAPRTLKNYLISFDGDKPKLKVRKGYTRFNSTALADVCTQLYVFRDLSNNEHILGILAGLTDSWYVIKASGAHVELQSAIANAPCPIVQFGDRVIFATDQYWYWSDDASIAGATKSFRLGIKKPTVAPALARAAELGPRVAAVPGSRIWLNTTTRYKFAAKMVLASATKIGSMRMCLSKPTAVTPAGNVVMKIYTDSGGSPTTTLADPNLVSWPWPVSLLAVNYLGGIDTNAKVFQFKQVVELDAGTYWVVLEADDEYRTNYSVVPAAEFYCDICYDQPGSPTWGYAKWWNNSTSAWDATNYEPHLLIGGLDTTYWYDYIFTYLNSSYGSESRPSAYTRIKPIAATRGVNVTGLSASADAQVDKVRVYRRQVTNEDDTDDDITDSYKFVEEVNEAAACFDYYSTAALGAELQTEDHYCFDDVDETNSGKRDSALQPGVGAVWKDRICFAELTKNVLYMSKLLEQDGRTGWAGKAIPDYFPLDNQLEIPEPSDIVALRQLSDDQLVVYFRNGAIWIVEGFNQILNPPNDHEFRQVLTNTGLIAPRGLAELRGRHIYLAQEGLHSFFGTPNPEYLSQPIQSILDDIETAYLDDTIIASFGDEVWVLVDADNDGNKESIYVLDIQRSVPAWRQYVYGVNLNDIVVRPTGSTFKTLLAADADNKYILELQSGTTDNGMAIETEIETHDLRVADRLSIVGVQLDGYYPTVPAAYTIVVRNHIGDESSYRIEPQSSEDVRGHKTGCLVTTGPTARVRVEGRSVNEDELLSLSVEYVER